ncbi:GNAT family N-acetyltransferase [Salipiger aestuarii]|uniref:RimJ/RimL family protein N-acetyltransferase n=1 Tax=Salipiger aestuarii TaxID=568098 RepID=A0A327Y1Y3_9RHOB|nr:GNAT family N-acetyltransferase [Salipiger aestuarii]EIE50548.1 acetyltransferase, putative [Citreicella sp. 357]RAK15013.1 RimJ/RimL family protein N-acetyltransferase [Salipiger aestuarii]
MSLDSLKMPAGAQSGSDARAQQVIEADRLVLRPLRRSDAGLITLYSGDERLARMTTSIPHPLPPGTTESFIARAADPDREEDVWVMDGAGQGADEVMGVVSIRPVDTSQCEIGYWVAPPYWNTGLASETVKVLIDANPFRAETMFASVFQDNPASARVLTNAGFEYIGDAEAFSVARNAKVATWTYLRRMR